MGQTHFLQACMNMCNHKQQERSIAYGYQPRSYTAHRAPASLWYIIPGDNKIVKDGARTAFAVPVTTVLQ